MNRITCLSMILPVIILLGCSDHSQRNHSPYAGEENRNIKALSAQEVKGYLEGNGMGLSKVAELNHYPGPRHVLELSEKLELTPEQYQQTNEIYKQMKNRARKIGKQYIDKEQELNALFESGNISVSEADTLLKEIGILKADLRSVHVQAHIKMKGVLDSEQIEKYDELRGYGDATAPAQHSTHEGHQH